MDPLSRFMVRILRSAGLTYGSGGVVVLVVDARVRILPASQTTAESASMSPVDVLSTRRVRSMVPVQSPASNLGAKKSPSGELAVNRAELTAEVDAAPRTLDAASKNLRIPAIIFAAWLAMT